MKLFTARPKIKSLRCRYYQTCSRQFQKLVLQVMSGKFKTMFLLVSYQLSVITYYD